MKKNKRYAPGVSYEKVLAKFMQDPAFKREYAALEPEFQIIRQIIELRIKRKMTQTELARRIGTAQPNVARLESQKRIKNLDYLQRIANALDADVQVRIVPRAASGARNRRGVKKV
jgi:DNA-binding Xre family transcriptional regulator